MLKYIHIIRGTVKTRYDQTDPWRWLGKTTSSGRFYLYGLTSIPAWISNHTPTKVRDEITYPFLNFNGTTVCTVQHLIIIIVQTYLKALNLLNACQIYFVECVKLSIFSPLSIIQYVGLYVFSLPISLVMIGRIYILCLIIIIKSEVWTITHCLVLGHETMVSAVCLSIFLWICDMAGLLRGTFVSWWYLPRIWPSVTDMQYYYHARYPTDDWHLAYMCSLVYFSVEVCLEGVFHHFVSTWRDSCVMVYAPLTLAPPPPPKSNREDPALHLNQARWHLN